MNTLTDAERQAATEALENSRRLFHESVAGLTESQWRFRSAPERWSLAEIAEHIALSEKRFSKLITEKIPAAETADTALAETAGKDANLLRWTRDRRRRVDAPDFMKPAARWATPAETVQAFEAMRSDLIGYVQATTDDLRRHAFQHLAFGQLDGYQWILLTAGHCERHVLQLLEEKSHPDFPA